MGVVVITDEGGTPATPADGAALFSVTGTLKYRDDGGTVHEIVTDNNPALGNGAVTDTMLATDVKVGSLASLTTTAKSSAVAAINEVDALIGAAASASGSIGTSIDTDGTLKAGAVDVAAVLASNVVETAKIADDAVTAAKIADDAVTAAKIADNVVGATYNPGVDLTLEAMSDEVVSLAAINNAFAEGEQLNLYDPALAVDGKLINYSSGAAGTYATSAILGKFTVEAGKTYCLSMPDTEAGWGYYVMCYNAANVYLGLDRALTTYPVAGGVTRTVLGTVNGRHQIRLAIAADSLVAKIDTQILFPYATHTTDQFNTLRNSIQIEQSDSFTYFEPYGTSPLKLSEYALPPGYLGLDDRVGALEDSQSASASISPVTVVADGDYYYIRTAWDATYDLVEKVARQATTATYDNKLFQFQSIGLVPVATASADLPTTTLSVTLKTETDDTAPANFNGTYIGASHGAYDLYQITVVAHGKTTVDIGSEWVDSVPIKFYIMRIVDANTLWILSENKSTTGNWDFRAPTGLTLTHSANATNTGSMTISGTNVQSQLYPAVKNKNIDFYLDGQTEIEADGVYGCDFLRVVCNYDISDVDSILAYVMSRVGNTSQPAFDHSSIATIAHVQIAYDFHENGSCTIWQSFRPDADIYLNYLGFIQSSAVSVPSGGALWQYVPDTASFTIGANTYDLAARHNITSLEDSLDLSDSRWLDADKPPHRFVQYAKTSGNALYNNFGFAIGYNTELGNGVPATRKTRTDSNAANIWKSQKMYPHLVSGNSSAYTDTILPEDTVVDAVSFRCPINYSYDTEATCIAWYFVGSDIYLMLDYHATINRMVTLPKALWGKKIAVVDKHANFTLGSSFVGPDGIYVNVASSYGWAILKLT